MIAWLEQHDIKHRMVFAPTSLYNYVFFEDSRHMTLFLLNFGHEAKLSVVDSGRAEVMFLHYEHRFR